MRISIADKAGFWSLVRRKKGESAIKNMDENLTDGPLLPTILR